MGSCVTIESNANIPDILDIDPEDWKHADVIEWLRLTSNGKLYPLIHSFKQHKINGISFMKLTNDDLLRSLNIQQFDLRKQFINERVKLVANYTKKPIMLDKITIPILEQSSDNSDSLTCSIFKTPTQIDEELSDDTSPSTTLIQELKRHKMDKLISDNTSLAPSINIKKSYSSECSSFTLSPSTFSHIAGTLFQNKSKNTSLYKHVSLSEDINIRYKQSKQYQIIRKAKAIKEEYKFNPKTWNFNISSFNNIKSFDNTMNDYHVLQQYENYCYLYGSKLIIDRYFNEFQQQILHKLQDMNKDENNMTIPYIIPKEIKNICYKFYFEYEYHIFQFGYDISRIVDHIDVYYGGPLTFEGFSLIELLYATHLKKKYNIISDLKLIKYVNELVLYGFIERVATKRKKGIFYGVNNNFYSLQQSKINENDIKNTLYRYDTNKKEDFDKYEEFINNKYDRNAWTIGTEIQIFSSALGGWKKGEIIDINANNKNDIVVQYDANNDNINNNNNDNIVIKYGIHDMKLCKRVNKNNHKIVKSTREFILNRQQWTIGTNIEIFNIQHNMWFSGKIINIIKPTQFQVNPSVKAARRRMKNVKDILFCVSHNTLFEPDKISYFGTWEPNIRDASFHINHNKNLYDNYGNRKNLIWYGFVRMYSEINIPKDIIDLIHKFCENIIIWCIDKLNMKKLLNCAFKHVMIGPSFDISDGIYCQLTLCPRDNIDNDNNDEYTVCYLEIKHIPSHIKSVTFSLQFFCGELQHDCRGTIFYNMNKKVKYNAWSWGKNIISFKNNIIAKNLKALNIECGINIINIEYKKDINNIYWLLPRYKFMQNTQYVWNIDEKLLNIFKNSNINRIYFNEILLNYCWMLSCEPQGNNNNVYLTLHLIKLPFKTLSKFIQVSFQWEVYANNSVFQSKWKTHKFKLNIKDGFEDSKKTICMCSSALLKCLSSLTFKINIRVNNRGYIV